MDWPHPWEAFVESTNFVLSESPGITPTWSTKVRKTLTFDLSNQYLQKAVSQGISRLMSESTLGNAAEKNFGSDSAYFAA